MLYNKRRVKKSNDYSFVIMLVIVIIMTAGFKSQNWEKRLIIEVAILVIYFVAIILKKSGVCGYFIRTKADISSGFNVIDTMSGEEFELLLAEHFKKKGYLVKTTAKSHDYGADLLLVKKGKRTVVQVKRYKSKIGIEAIQQAYSSMPYYKADACMVITNSYYTSSARKLAERNHVILWDRDILTRKFDIKD